MVFCCSLHFKIRREHQAAIGSGDQTHDRGLTFWPAAWADQNNCRGKRLNHCILVLGSAVCWQVACTCPGESRSLSSVLEAPGIQTEAEPLQPPFWPSPVRTFRAKTRSLHLCLVLRRQRLSPRTAADSALDAEENVLVLHKFTWSGSRTFLAAHRRVSLFKLHDVYVPASVFVE